MRELTRDEAMKLQPIIGRYLRFTGKLTKRLDHLGIDPTSEVYQASLRAFNGLHALSAALHYATCESGVGKRRAL